MKSAPEKKDYISGSIPEKFYQRKISRLHIVIFAIIFAIPSTILLLLAFASSQPFTITIPSKDIGFKSTKRVPGFNRGTQATALYTNDKGIGKVQLPGEATSMTVLARSDSCRGDPIITVSVAGKTVYSRAISPSDGGVNSKHTWKNYTLQLKKKLPKGNHVFTVYYSNDFSIKSELKIGEGDRPQLTEGCDRNVYINSISFSGIKASFVQPPPPPPPPEDQVATVIFLKHPARPTAEAESEYTTIAKNKSVHAALRSSDSNKNNSDMLSWESKKYNYYWTAASSDYTNGGNAMQKLYVPTADGNEIIKRPKADGLYFHEVLTLLALKRNWDWNNAVNDLDWTRLTAWVDTAKAQGKKIVWSEAAEGWLTIAYSAKGQAFLKHAGNTVVPMYATNFPNSLDTAIAGATLAKNNHQLANMGASVQSWYFIDQAPPQPVTAAGTNTLLDKVYGTGVNYYQIEGNTPDMVPSSAYMTTINTYIKNRLVSTAPPPKPVSKIPLYMLWNNVLVDHYYTADPTTRDNMIATGWDDAGNSSQPYEIIGYIATQHVPGTTPLFELWDADYYTDHFYTTSVTERDAAKNSHWNDTNFRIVGYVASSSTNSTTPLYRLWSDGTLNNLSYADHFYTVNAAQKDQLVANPDPAYLHYKYEGITGYLYKNAQ